MPDFLKDPKTLTGIVAAVVGVVAQVMASKGYVIDKPTADSITGLIVVVALGVMGSHAHVENAEAHADGNVQVAKENAKA